MFRGAQIISSNEFFGDSNFNNIKNDNTSSTHLPTLFPIERQRYSSSALSTLGYSLSDRSPDIRRIKSSRSLKLSRSITSPPNVPLNFLDIQRQPPHGNS
jgi:hypothetical protein